MIGHWHNPESFLFFDNQRLSLAVSLLSRPFENGLSFSMDSKSFFQNSMYSQEPKMGMQFHHSHNCRQVSLLPVAVFLDLSYIPGFQVSFPFVMFLLEFLRAYCLMMFRPLGIPTFPVSEIAVRNFMITSQATPTKVLYLLFSGLQTVTWEMSSFAKIAFRIIGLPGINSGHQILHATPQCSLISITWGSKQTPRGIPSGLSHSQHLLCVECALVTL